MHAKSAPSRHVAPINVCTDWERAWDAMIQSALRIREYMRAGDRRLRELLEHNQLSVSDLMRMVPGYTGVAWTSGPRSTQGVAPMLLLPPGIQARPSSKGPPGGAASSSTTAIPMPGSPRDNNRDIVAERVAQDVADYVQQAAGGGTLKWR